MTVLFWAAYRGFDDVVKLCLVYPGIDVNAALYVSILVAVSWLCIALMVELITQDGRTPLSVAAEQGHSSVVSLLLADRRVNVHALASVCVFAFCRDPFVACVRAVHTSVRFCICRARLRFISLPKRDMMKSCAYSSLRLVSI